MSEELICPVCQSHNIRVEEDDDETVYICEMCGHTWEDDE